MSTYSFIRILLTIIIFSILFFIIKKFVSINKQRISITITVICCGLLLSVFNLIPFENNFMSFKTPQDAFGYYSNKNIELQIEGNDTCLLIADGNQRTIQILDKNKKGWNIRSGLDVDITPLNSIDTVFICKLNIKSSQDTYIEISNATQSDLLLSDNKNSKFYQASKGVYYAYVSDFSNNYVLSVNEKEVTF